MSRYRFPLFLIPGLAVLLLLSACSTVHRPKPTPTPAPARPRPTPAPPRTSSLRDFLKGKLGANYHTREEWAGSDPDYQPKPLSYRVWSPIGQVYAVTIHHAEMRPRADTAEMIRSIFSDHTRVGGRLDAADVGYHFFVDERGQVWEGRDAGHVGTHVGSRPPGRNNPGNLGICALGSYVWEDPPQIVVEQVSNLAVLIAQYYRRPLIVRGHRDWSGINGLPEGDTTCPGRLECAVGVASTKMAAAFPAGAAQGTAVAGLPAKTQEVRMNH